MLAQLVLDALASGAVTFGLLSARSHFRRRQTDPNRWGAIPWTYRRSGNGTWGFYCPKCININKNATQMPHCSCEQYHKDHFHFKCGDCGYQAIMRTADDRE